MKDIYKRIKSSKEETILLEAGILSESGRLSDEGMSVFLSLLFRGATVSEARNFIVVEAEKIIKEK